MSAGNRGLRSALQFHFPGETFPRPWGLKLRPFSSCVPSRTALVVRCLPTLVGWLAGGGSLVYHSSLSIFCGHLAPRRATPVLPQRPLYPSPCYRSLLLPGGRPRLFGRLPLSPPRDQDFLEYSFPGWNLLIFLNSFHTWSSLQS